MKQKQILIGGVIVVVLGLGIYALVKSRGSASGSGDEAAPENVPSVVTVQLGALKQMTLHRYVSGYGTVEAAPATADQPAAGAQLAAPTAGVVTKVNVIEGRQVQKGDVLVELNSGTATFASAQAAAERQRKLYRAAKHVAEKFAGRRGATGLVASHRAVVRHRHAAQRQARRGGGREHARRGGDGFEPAGRERGNSGGGGGGFENRRGGAN